MKKIIMLFLMVSYLIYSDEYSVVQEKNFIRNWEGLGGLEKYKVQKDGVLFYFPKKRRLKINILAEDIFRVRFNKKGVYRAKEKSYAIINNDFENKEFTVNENDDYVEINTEKMTLKVRKKNFGIELYKGEKLVHSDSENAIEWNENRVVNYKKIAEGSSYYGFGEKAGNLNKKGEALKMWNTDAYKYDKKTDPLYLSIPFFIERNENYNLGILYDNTYQTYFNMGEASKENYYIGALDGGLNYYLIYGENSKEVINKYTKMTGRMSMPPLWALGFQQCRFSYYPESRVMEVAENFRKKEIPADVIYLDIDFMDNFKSFTWNKAYFPNPKKMIDNLHEMGFKVITIIDPGIKAEKGYHVYDSGIKGDYFLKNKYGDLAKGSVWPGECVFPDFTSDKVKTWWGDLYKPMLDLGFDGFWNDMNEPSLFDSSIKTLPMDTVHKDGRKKASHAKMHNVYGQAMIQSTLEGLDRLKPENRNFVLSRSGYAGVQRYAAVWTGDNTANWEHLKLNLTMALNMGMSGLAMVGADVGGYSGTPSDELMTRWMQLGLFFPLYRNHTEKDTRDQEIWAFGKESEKAMKEAVVLRYELLQYLYDAIYETHQTGIPVLRPLFMEFEDDKNLADIDDEFMFGESILVAPVMKEGVESREVYLPKGTKWYEYNSKKEYEGGEKYQIETALNYIPIFVKSGSIIPWRELEQYVGEKRKNYLTIEIYGDASNEYTLHLDDGESKAYKNGELREILFKKTESKLKVKTLNSSYKTKENYYYIKINGEEKEFSINNEKLRKVNSKKKLNYKSYYYNSIEKAAYFKIDFSEESIIIK